jgi:hypothetical protein
MSESKRLIGNGDTPVGSLGRSRPQWLVGLRGCVKAGEMAGWEAATDNGFLAIASGARGSARYRRARRPRKPSVRRTPPNACCGRNKWKALADPRNRRPPSGNASMEDKWLAGGDVPPLRNTRQPAAGGHPSAARYADLETGSSPQMPFLQDAPIRATGAHDQAHQRAEDCALPLGSPRRRSIRTAKTGR